MINHIHGIRSKARALLLSMDRLTFFCFKTDNLIENFDYMEYKVLISEEVNFIEFNQKYEIIEQEGEIFTIKERASNDDKAGM